MDLFIVWDVGQGSWSTLLSNNMCLHFDMGGQKPPPRSFLFANCKGKRNLLALSHLDKDHVVFIKKFSTALDLCLIDKNLFPKHKAIHFIKQCADTPKYLKRIRTALFLERNDGHVYLWKNTVLVTGDLHRHLELFIIPKLTNNKIQFLLAGHHGSKTSSHPLLIKKLTCLHQAIVSAKKTTYGHPHAITKNTFKKYRVPLIETQLFGALVYEL